MTFQRYQHIERLRPEYQADLDGLLNGTVYVYPKLDGANHCVWYEDDMVKCGSRNQEQTEAWHTTKFWQYVQDHPEIKQMAEQNKQFIFYGEFLTRHTIRDYDQDAYGEWYVFDVYDAENNIYLPYDFYPHVVESFGVKCIPLIGKKFNPTYEWVASQMKDATYLHGDTPGEGIVIKNYEYRNVYGRQTWGKLLNSDFIQIKADKHDHGSTPESQLIENLLTQDFVSKEKHKLLDETGVEWNDKLIGTLLPIIREEFYKDYGYEILMKARDMNTSELNKAINKLAVKMIRRC